MSPEIREAVRQNRLAARSTHYLAAEGTTEVPRIVTTLDALRDALARVTRAHEALTDGDPGFAEAVLDDLTGDLWRLIERQERESKREAGT